MTKDKKDLTRIEDLAEFVHEDDGGEDFELPSLPEEEIENESEFATFESNEEVAPEESEPFTTEFQEEPSYEEKSLVEESTEDFLSEAEPTQELDSDSFSFGSEAEEPSEPEIETEETSFEESFDPIEDMVTETFEPTPVTQASILSSPQEDYKLPETFTEVKTFVESAFSGDTSGEANPSFSVLIKNVRYIEDVQDIVALLKEFNLLTDSEETIKSRLSRGNLLVPRISEYVAIALAHKLRRFDIDVLLGLSDEIHPPKHQEAPELGLVSKQGLYQNQNHHFHFDDPKLEVSQIIVAATPTLEGHQIIRYIGVATEHRLVDGQNLEDESSPEVPGYYHELAQKLKAHAVKAHANAVVGLNYQLTPIPSEYGLQGQKFRLSCTGNLVWITKL